MRSIANAEDLLIVRSIANAEDLYILGQDGKMGNGRQNAACREVISILDKHCFSCL